MIAITGNGLKTQEAVLDRLEEPALINAKLSEFDGLVHEHKNAPKRRQPAVAVRLVRKRESEQVRKEERCPR